MKNFFLSLVLVITTLSTLGQEPLPSYLNTQEIEKEFMILYQKRCDSLKHKISVDNSLLCITENQVNYLKGFSGGFITHDQVENPKLHNIFDRMVYFYPKQKQINDFTISEVCAIINTNNMYFTKYAEEYTNKYLAHKLFNCLINSKPHREIMDMKELSKVCFKVGFNKTQAVFIVGVLSAKTLY